MGGGMSDPTDFDAIVVGSGISGGWVAKELCERGLKTLMLERGPNVQHGSDYTDMLQPWEVENRGAVNQDEAARDYQIQSKCYAFNNANKQWWVKDSEHPYTFPPERPFFWMRGYHVGGRSLMWGRQTYRWSDIDFGANSKDGYGVDWPIRYADIAPWYDHVERFAGISGAAEGLAQLPDGEFQPPMDFTIVELEFKRRMEASYPTRRMTIGRCAHLTKPTDEQVALGRSPCQFRSLCERGCVYGAYFSTQSATLPAAQRTGNLTVQPDTIVHSVICDPTGKRVTGVRVIDANTKQGRSLTARAVFVNASTIATAALLLNSTSEAFPNGLANRSDQVGRNLMDHVSGFGASGVWPGDMDRYYFGRRPNGTYIPRYVNVTEPTDSFVRGFGFQGGAMRSSWQRGIYEPGIGEALKNQLRMPGSWSMHSERLRRNAAAGGKSRHARCRPDRPLGHAARPYRLRLWRKRAEDGVARQPGRQGDAGARQLSAREGAHARQRRAGGPGAARLRHPRDGHRADGARSGDLRAQSMEPGARCAEPDHHGRRMHGLFGMPEPVADLHGAFGTSREPRGGDHEGGHRMSRSENPSRRTMLAAGAVLAAAATSSRAFAAPGNEHIAAIRGVTNARPGLQLYTIRSEMQKDVPGSLKRVAQIGYKEVEFAGYFGHTPADIRRLVADTGMTAPSSHVQLAMLRSNAAQTIADATAAGHQFLVLAWIPPEERTTVEMWKGHAALLNAFGAKCRQAGLRLAYHNHDFEFAPVGGVLPYDVLVQNTDPALVAFELDMYWAKKGGQDLDALLAKHQGRIVMVHVKDMLPNGEMTDVGLGTVDFRRILAAPAAMLIEHYFVENDDTKNSVRIRGHQLQGAERDPGAAASPLSSRRPALEAANTGPKLSRRHRWEIRVLISRIVTLLCALVFALPATAAPVKILMLGTSLTQGYGLPLGPRSRRCSRPASRLRTSTRRSSMPAFPATPPRAGCRGSTGRWRTARCGDRGTGLERRATRHRAGADGEESLGHSRQAEGAPPPGAAPGHDGASEPGAGIRPRVRWHLPKARETIRRDALSFSASGGGVEPQAESGRWLASQSGRGADRRRAHPA